MAEDKFKDVSDDPNLTKEAMSGVKAILTEKDKGDEIDTRRPDEMLKTFAADVLSSYEAGKAAARKAWKKWNDD